MEKKTAYFLFLVLFALVIMAIAIYFTFWNEPFCCGAGTARRIDVVYPPDIFIGQRGSFNAYTGFQNPWNNCARDKAFVEQRLNNPSRNVFLN